MASLLLLELLASPEGGPEQAEVPAVQGRGERVRPSVSATFSASLSSDTALPFGEVSIAERSGRASSGSLAEARCRAFVVAMGAPPFAPARTLAKERTSRGW
ncbi:MAG TPA: hypothetical protein VEX11_02565 [Acetobacteraceae bacterium]|nr:hypothetical protein [Acetobacteraceae bacterium]